MSDDDKTMKSFTRFFKRGSSMGEDETTEKRRVFPWLKKSKKSDDTKNDDLSKEIGGLEESPSADSKSSLFGKFLSISKKTDQAEEVVGDIVENDIELDIEFGGGKTILVENKTVALGLFWQTKSSEDKIKQIAKDNSEIANFDLYSLVSQNRQIGLIGTEEGVKPSHFVGVTIFPKPFWQRDWLGAFQIDGSGERFWIVAIRDGMVYQDAVFETQAAAQEQFSIESGAPGWEMVYAPIDWNVAGTLDTPLGRLASLKTAKKVSFVSPIRKHLFRIIMGVGLTVILGSGYYYITYTQEQQRLAEEQLRILREEQLRTSQADIPWRQYFEPMEFVRECQTLMTEYTIFAPGWNQTDMRCSFDGNSININTGWTRQAGRIAYLRALMPEYAGRLVLDASGNRVDLALSFAVETEDLSGRLTPWEPARITRVLSERFQTMGLPIQLAQVVQQPAARRGSGASVPQQAVFNFHEVTFRTTAAIDEYFRLLSDVPGVIPERIDYNLRDNTYSVVARAYHPPIGL